MADIRRRWPKVRIVLRADSGFAREELMAWCEANGIDHLFGLARNRRLLEQIAAELQAAEAEHKQTGKPARRFKGPHLRDAGQPEPLAPGDRQG